MSKVFLFASLSVLAAVGLMLTGCSGQQAGQQAPAAPEASQDEPAAADHEDHEDHEGHDHGDHDHADHDHGGHDHAEYEEALSQLSPADRALAEKQEICPVSGGPLGSMGTPYKVTVQGREVLLCCSGCEDKIKENPEEYLAKLPE